MKGNLRISPAFLLLCLTGFATVPARVRAMPPAPEVPPGPSLQSSVAFDKIALESERPAQTPLVSESPDEEPPEPIALEREQPAQTPLVSESPDEEPLEPIALESEFQAQTPLVSEAPGEEPPEPIALESEQLSQTPPASRFRDVQPTDWAFEALRSLQQRYDCLAGYPDGTYRGNRPLTRYEFAAGLNACLNRIEEFLQKGQFAS